GGDFARKYFSLLCLRPALSDFPRRSIDGIVREKRNRRWDIRAALPRARFPARDFVWLGAHRLVEGPAGIISGACAILSLVRDIGGICVFPTSVRIASGGIAARSGGDRNFQFETEIY